MNADRGSALLEREKPLCRLVLGGERSEHDAVEFADVRRIAVATESGPLSSRTTRNAGCCNVPENCRSPRVSVTGCRRLRRRRLGKLLSGFDQRLDLGFVEGRR